MKAKAMNAILLLALASCALTSKARPLEVRYFSPELASAPAKAIVRASAPRVGVRLGRVTARGVPRDSLVHRDSAVELNRYDTLRWSEPPDEYVRRSLARALYERGRPIDQVVGGPAPSLDVEVAAFEEDRTGARPRGKVELRFTLHDERVVLDRGSVVIERDAAGAGPADVVIAIGAAMDAATAAIAERVAARLASEADAPCTTCVAPATPR
jgi:uncharacterized lipoprotein YmbA